MTTVEVQVQTSVGWETTRKCRTVFSARDWRRRMLRDGHKASKVRVLVTTTEVIR